MGNMRFYLSIFSRRLPYFLVVAGFISAIAVVISVTLPSAYVSTMRLLVESPQISNDLVNSQTTTPAVEQLQVAQQRLLTRANLLEIGNRFQVLKDIDKLNPDQIVQAMLVQTEIFISSGRGDPPLMSVSFEGRTPQIAFSVMNEYRALILEADTQLRAGRASQTLEFFEQEVTRLNTELAERSSSILEFKTNNADALPDSLDYRLGQQSLLQERLGQIERDIFGLTNQRDRLLEIFEATGQVADARLDNLGPEQRQLELLRIQLNEALAVYAPENPRVKLLEARIAQAQAAVNAAPQPSQRKSELNTGNNTLDVQIAAIDARIADLVSQKEPIGKQIEALNSSIERTPVNAIHLDELTLDYQNIQLQYNGAVDRLAKASIDERIEFMARGQRISVIEPPALPTQPSKPKRGLIAIGGSILGFMAGVALIVLMELMNRSIRRPEDIVAAFGISPLATIPYIQTRREVLLRRAWKILLFSLTLVGVPAAIYAVHEFYQPLDVIMERIMNKLGMRW